MERFSTEQRVKIVKTYYQNSENVSKTVKELRAVLGKSEAPDKPTVSQLIQKFETTGSVDTGRNGSQSGIAVRRRSNQLKIPRSLLRKILRKDLSRATIVPPVQEGKPAGSNEPKPQCKQVPEDIIEIT